MIVTQLPYIISLHTYWIALSTIGSWYAARAIVHNNRKPLILVDSSQLPLPLAFITFPSGTLSLSLSIYIYIYIVTRIIYN